MFYDHVKVKRIRNSEHQTLEIKINDDILLFAKYSRQEIEVGAPRIS